MRYTIYLEQNKYVDLCTDLVIDIGIIMILV